MRITPSKQPDFRPIPVSPADLDRLADRELQVGHHAKAERLAHLAAAMREARP